MHTHVFSSSVTTDLNSQNIFMFLCHGHSAPFYIGRAFNIVCQLQRAYGIEWKMWGLLIWWQRRKMGQM